jgi:hypothetical protein
MSEATEAEVQYFPPPEPILEIFNPYWEAVAQAPGDDIHARFDRRWVPAGYPPGRVLRQGGREIEEWYEKYGRTGMVQKYAWAIPSPSTLLWILEALDGRPVVEMGAGTGYWAWMLEQLGVDIVAYDEHPPLKGKNSWHCRNDQPGAQYFDIQVGTPEVLADHADRALFLSWPPYHNDMGYQALKAYPGDMLIEIGEGAWGCTGTEEFHDLLEKEWNSVDRGRMTQWSGIHDNITLWRRK